MSLNISDLDPITSFQDSDIFHARNLLGIDKKITGKSLTQSLRTILGKSADYTILDSDLNPVILLTTGATDKTIVLPTLADNQGKLVTLKKVDTGAGMGLLGGEGAELIDDYSIAYLQYKGDKITVIGTSSCWHRLEGEFDKWHYVGSGGGEPAFQNSWENYQSTVWVQARFRKNGNGSVLVQVMLKNGTASHVFTLPSGYRPNSTIITAGYRDGHVVCRPTINSSGAVSMTNYSAVYSGFNFVFKAEQ